MKGTLSGEVLTGSISGAQRLGGTATPRGNDGISPIVEIETYDWGNIVKITDVEGTKRFTVSNGSGGSGGGGYIPIRGRDYWTTEDIAEIKSYVDEAILGGAW